jgi:hypothetical protein
MMIDVDKPARGPAGGTRLARRAVAAVVVVVTVWLSDLLAFGLGYVTSPGAERLREMTPGLLTSAAVGVLGIAATLAVLRRRVVSPWLLLGLLPAVLAVLTHGGLVG